MVYDIKGKFAVITGGAAGIGLAYSKQLLKNGLAVRRKVDFFVKRIVRVFIQFISVHGA